MAVKENYTNGKKISGTSSADSIYSSGSSVTINAGKGNDSIDNRGNSVSINGGAGDDYIDNTDGRHIQSVPGKNVTIIGGDGNDTIEINLWDSKNNVIEYASGDGNDVIQLVNSSGGSEILIDLISGTLDKSFISDNRDIILKVGKGSIRFEYGAGNLAGGISVRDSTGAVTLINKKNTVTYSDNDDLIGFNSDIWLLDDVTIDAAGGNDYIYTECGNSSIYGGTGNDTIWNSGSFVNDSLNFGINSTLNGGAGNDYIYNYGIDSVLALGGAGNDTIESYGDSARDVTVNGGKGNDVVILSLNSNNVIQYSSGDGNDTVSGFNENDTLQIGNGKGTYSTKTSGSDIIVKVGKGKITLAGAASLETVNINGDMILTNASKSPVTIDAAIKTVNASKRTKAVKVTGNTLANTIQGGSKNDTIYGGAGNDSLWGGKGNDSLWGGSGADVFSYSAGEGKDVIYGFADNDMLKITGAFSATYSKSKDEVYFKVGATSKAITLSDFSATSFNVNGDIYQINGSKLVKK